MRLHSFVRSASLNAQHNSTRIIQPSVYTANTTNEPKRRATTGAHTDRNERVIAWSASVASSAESDIVFNEMQCSPTDMASVGGLAAEITRYGELELYTFFFLSSK